jgi:hypothetical protein
LKGIIDDPELEKALKFVSALNPESDVRDIIFQYLQGKDKELGTELSTQVSFDGAAQPAPAPTPAAPTPAAPAAPAAPAEPVPAAPVPVAERFMKAIQTAKAAGATQETVIRFSGKDLTIAEAAKLAGVDVNQIFSEDSMSNKQEEVVEFIKSMYDDVSGSFPKGETGVLIAVEKQFGEDVTDLANQVISELSTIYESKRLRQLAGITEHGLQQRQASVAEMFKALNARLQ